MSDKDSARQAVQQALGGRRGPYHAWNPVNEAMIWQWCQAFGEGNPLHSDLGFAQAAGYDHVLSPPAMLQGWCLPAIHRGYPPGSAPERPYAVLDVLGEHGYVGNVAVSCDQRFLQPVPVGQRLYYDVAPVHVSERKDTRLGRGYFITCLERYFVVDGPVVFESHTTYFQFQAPDVPEEEEPTLPPGSVDVAPPEQYAQEVIWDGAPSRGAIEVGQSTGALTVPVSASRIACCALASLDFMPVHHSAQAAQAQGQPDVFMNILTTGGFVSRLATDFLGPGSVVRRMKLSLGVPNYPGDAMRLNGKVTAVQREADQEVAILAMEGTNRVGVHVTATEVEVARTSPG